MRGNDSQTKREGVIAVVASKIGSEGEWMEGGRGKIETQRERKSEEIKKYR